eukprot:CAMPEP_0201729676 /NCGR_PEP_ID=MMETSP0593-20130828/19735_1 /ASSEMBLY_ACC=CAM_ASM_000672 /TAXON_ID=267983 /ORGANISM="Skeletonema japonicum, Strain CCMP2506" /LENGTH=150 /DNA_ID=CAMNT_0048222061 /DNA_START=181 /DNA_END=630 /DNA_ORIENTATION=-
MATKNRHETTGNSSRPSFKNNQSQLSDDGDYNVSEERYLTTSGQEVQLSRNNSPQSQEYTEELDMNIPDESPSGGRNTTTNNNTRGGKKIGNASGGHNANHSGGDAAGAAAGGGGELPYGSDVSSAEKYADRNSDPGVHCSERELLPVLP